jgi:hypothetical protein
MGQCRPKVFASELHESIVADRTLEAQRLICTSRDFFQITWSLSIGRGVDVPSDIPPLFRPGGSQGRETVRQCFLQAKLMSEWVGFIINNAHLPFC